jgi:APA family basic amino acid/polyamine antiporter
MTAPFHNSTTGLTRRLGLLALTATGICSMMGASINVVPFMIQRNVPGIGPYVLPAFLFAALPALIAAFCYASLASAMPRAGGSYVYVSRGLNPYLGFIASFSQWFGLSIVIGVISYIIVPFIRDVFDALEMEGMVVWLETGWTRVVLALILLWAFVVVNILGAKVYERTLIPLMFLMFGLGMIIIGIGWVYNQSDFLYSIEDISFMDQSANFEWKTFLMASTLLFSSFIGFDSIAQAGGEAKNPAKNLPRSIALAILIVGGYYFIFTQAVYSTVPWQFVYTEAMTKDITAPGLLSTLLPAGLSVAVLAGAAIALINDLPAMILSVSRMMFAWAEDGIFPRAITEVNKKYQTPQNALIASGIMASIGIFGSHFAGDFFLGIDIMVTSMMVNFLLVCISLSTVSRRNPDIAKRISVFRNHGVQRILASLGIVLLLVFLLIHSWKDLKSPAEAWYFHSTPVWILVMTIGTLIYLFRYYKLKRSGIDLQQHFIKLPPE